MGRGIVHVIDPTGGGDGLLGGGAAADVAILACAEAVRARAGHAHVVIALGTNAAAQHAARLGLRVHAVVPTLLGHAGLACRQLRRVVRELGGADILQPWSERARTACRLAAAGEGPIATVPIDTWPSIGEPVGSSRSKVKRSLGVPENVPVVALLADPTRHADARRFVYMIGLLDVGGIPVAGVVDRRSAHVSRARRFHAEAGVRWRMLLPNSPIAELLHACDVGVIVPPSTKAALSGVESAWVRWSVVRAHSMGVPVIGAGAWLPRKAWPTEGGALLRARSESITDIGRLLAALVADSDGLAALAEAVRTGAHRIATRERFGDALEENWQRASGIGQESALRTEAV